MSHFLDAVFKLADGIEGLCRKIQGKGFGASSIKSEYRCALQVLGYEPKLVIDIGANVGNYTAEMRNKSSSTEIHAFEPSLNCVKLLIERFGSDRKVFIVASAVAEFGGKAVLFSNQAGSVYGSLSKRDMAHRKIDFELQENVSMMRFEDYWRNTLKCRPIDFVKLDIEGHELSALAGFGEALNHIKVIQFEFGAANIDTKTYFKEFWIFLTQRNFKLGRISPLGIQKLKRYHENDEFFWTTNYLAYRNPDI